MHRSDVPACQPHQRLPVVDAVQMPKDSLHLVLGHQREKEMQEATLQVRMVKYLFAWSKKEVLIQGYVRDNYP